VSQTMRSGPRIC